MTRFSSCPWCGRKLEGGLLGGAYFPVYRCRKCRARFCQEDIHYGECPQCGSKDHDKIGEVR